MTNMGTHEMCDYYYLKKIDLFVHTEPLLDFISHWLNNYAQFSKTNLVICITN